MHPQIHLITTCSDWHSSIYRKRIFDKRSQYFSHEMSVIYDVMPSFDLGPLRSDYLTGMHGIYVIDPPEQDS